MTVPQVNQILCSHLPIYPMKFISWNIIGLNSPSKHKILKKMIMEEHPAIFYMQETKCTSSTLEAIFKKIWKGSNIIAVNANGASGGLSIIWNPQIINLENLQANKNFIQGNFHLVGTDIHGLLTNFYAPQNVQQKLMLLRNIEKLNLQRSHPLWLLGGDLNMITNLQGNKGGRQHLESDINGFKEFIQSNNLIYLQT